MRPSNVGVPLSVSRSLSGLAKAGVAGVYNRALYLEDRKLALWAWQYWLSDLNQMDRVLLRQLGTSNIAAE